MQAQIFMVCVFFIFGKLKDNNSLLRFSNFWGITRWCPETESNRRHGDFQSPALPTELSGQRRLLNHISPFQSRKFCLKRAYFFIHLNKCVIYRICKNSQVQSNNAKLSFWLINDATRLYIII